MSEERTNGDGLHCFVGRCGDCQHFQRGQWLPDYGGGEQLGGSCKVLRDVLGMTNSHLVWHDALYVQESFGCSLFTPNAPHEPAREKGLHETETR